MALIVKMAGPPWKGPLPLAGSTVTATIFWVLPSQVRNGWPPDGLNGPPLISPEPVLTVRPEACSMLTDTSSRAVLGSGSEAHTMVTGTVTNIRAASVGLPTVIVMLGCADADGMAAATSASGAKNASPTRDRTRLRIGSPLSGCWPYVTSRVGVFTRAVKGASSRGQNAPCRGWPASGPDRLRPGPWFLAGVSAEVSRIKRDFACTFTRHFHLCSLASGRSRAAGVQAHDGLRYGSVDLLGQIEHEGQGLDVLVTRLRASMTRTPAGCGTLGVCDRDPCIGLACNAK